MYLSQLLPWPYFRQRARVEGSEAFETLLLPLSLEHAFFFSSKWENVKSDHSTIGKDLEKWVFT
jgi:hypothetical protein